MHTRINSKQVLVLISLVLILFVIAFGVASGQSQPQPPTTSSNESTRNIRSFTPTNETSSTLYLLYSIRGGGNEPIYHLYAVSTDAPLSPITIPGNPLLNQFINSQTQFAWSAKTGIFLIQSDGDKLYVLREGAPVPTPFKTPTSPNLVYYSAAQWAPDGQSVVFVLLDGTASPDVSTYYLAVYTSDGTLHKIAGPYTSRPGHGGDVIRNPSWSPDGQYIVFEHSSVLGTGDMGAPSSTSILEVITTTCLANPVAVCQISSLSPQNTSSFTPLSPASPVALGTGPVDTSEEWLSPSWFPDSNRLLFICGTAYSNVFDLCTLERNGSNFTRLFPGWGLYALSPDGRFIAHLDDSGIKLFDMPSGRDIVVVPLSQDEEVGMMVWVSQQSVQSLLQLPTLEPSPTASLKLSLKPLCLYPNTAWRWIVINPNPQKVYGYTLELHNTETNTVVTSTVGVADAATNATPGTGLSLDTTAGPFRVRLYMNGVLQDDQAVPPLPCRRTS